MKINTRPKPSIFQYAIDAVAKLYLEGDKVSHIEGTRVLKIMMHNEDLILQHEFVNTDNEREIQTIVCRVDI